MCGRLRRFIHGEDAATAVEYAVVLALILMVAIGAVMVFGNAVGDRFDSNNTALEDVNFGS
jgi:Flp pilus assembly pilin Flp